MENYKWTFTGFVLAFVLWFSIAALNIDVFEAIADFLQNYEHHELDEVIFPIAIIYVFAMADMANLLRNRQIHKARFKIYQEMMKAVQHILNNFLQKMMLFKLTAEKTDGFDPKVLDLYDHIIEETTDQIETLGSIKKPDEKSIENAITPPYSKIINR